ncbi:hypothetical protein SAMN06269301_3027 [Geobacter sp. DSM 9736]|nr:hypothetical protein SAMN06269301_3027 [Geobacter sp. DSM 9736]
MLHPSHVPSISSTARIRLAGTLAALIFVTGCAASTTFAPYPNKITPYIQNLQTKKQIDFSRSLLNECRSSDRILYSMERGRIAQILGNFDMSLQDFMLSIEAIKEKEDRALVSASGIGAQLAAVSLNDNAIPYEGEGYERVMLHHFQAMNYLGKRDLEGAGVEIRRANAEQEDALRRFERDLEKARREAEEKQIDANPDNPVLLQQYAQLDEVAGSVKNSFQNAYTFYLSGIVYELIHQPGDAYIDYKKALEIFPENMTLQRDVFRLARQLGMTQDLEDLKGRFPLVAQGVKDDLSVPAGELVVLFEDGFVPQKQEMKIPFPVPRVGVVAMAFPMYQGRWVPPMPLYVADGGRQIGRTEPVCDIRALAVKSLKEKVPALAIRQTIRAVSKGATVKMAEEKLGPLGSFGAGLWNLLSENADLRSWITLPDNAQIMRVRLPPGSYWLSLQHDGTAAASEVGVEIREGGKTILRVVRAGSEIYSAVMSF